MNERCSSHALKIELQMLKIDLGITTNVYDDRLRMYLQSAKEFITREGATLREDSMEDSQLIVLYAAWMWRRRDTGKGMPRMLRWQLNNRIMSEKMQEETDG